MLCVDILFLNNFLLKNQRIPTVYRLIEYNDYSVMLMQRAPQTLLVRNHKLEEKAASRAIRD